MKRLMLLLLLGGSIVFLAWGIQGIYSAKMSQSYVKVYPTQKAISINSDKLFELVNDWRIQNGLSSFVKSDSVCQFASIRLPQTEKNWSHAGFQNLHDSIAPSEYMGENLARSYKDEQSILTGWIHSPEHLANLKRPFKYSCIKTDGSYVVQEFATIN